MASQELLDSAIMFKLGELWDFSQKRFVNIWLLKIEDYWVLQCGLVFWNKGKWDTEVYSQFENKEQALVIFDLNFGWIATRGRN